jgi:hypothetical protein
MSSPYRTCASPDSAVDDPDSDALPDADVLPFLVVFWLASVARVGAGIALRETMGAETTTALLAVLFVPLMLSEPIAWWWNKRWSRRYRRRSLR